MAGKVTVVGAGFYGSTTAQRIAEYNIADTVVLTDILEGKSEGLALDMNQSRSIEGFETKIVGQTTTVEGGGYDHQAFRPWRLMALAFKALRRIRPDYDLWRDFPYEYERDRLAIDLINGSELLRRWVDDPAATPADLDSIATADEKAWQVEREGVMIYR